MHMIKSSNVHETRMARTAGKEMIERFFLLKPFGFVDCRARPLPANRRHCSQLPGSELKKNKIF